MLTHMLYMWCSVRAGHVRQQYIAVPKHWIYPQIIRHRNALMVQKKAPWRIPVQKNCSYPQFFREAMRCSRSIFAPTVQLEMLAHRRAFSDGRNFLADWEVGRFCLFKCSTFHRVLTPATCKFFRLSFFFSSPLRHGCFCVSLFQNNSNWNFIAVYGMAPLYSRLQVCG